MAECSAGTSGGGHARWWLAAVAIAFAVTTHALYTGVIAPNEAFAFMGVRSAPVSLPTLLLFTTLALLPVIVLPVHLERPSDLVVTFLYYAVHVPTAMLMPHVAASAVGPQAVFVSVTATSFAVLAVPRRLRLLATPAFPIPPLAFWGSLALFAVAAVALFTRSPLFSLTDLRLLEVYDQRQLLADNAAVVGPVFFYAANWVGGALAPFSLVAGIVERRWGLLAIGTGLAFAAFVASSNKVNYFAVPVVLGGTWWLRRTGGRHLGATMGGAFVALAGVLWMVDLFLMANGSPVPLATWTVFHRTFTNNGFLSAIYLDLFRDLPFAEYQDSFLRWAPGPKLPTAIPILAGASFTDVPDVFANANLWADGYANAGVVGMLFATLFAALTLWIYDGVASRHPRTVAAALLIYPASVLANTAMHTTLSSNGFAIIFLLLMCWPVRHAHASPQPLAT